MRASFVIIALVMLTSITLGQERTFTVSNTTPNCRDGNRATHRVCLPDGQRVGEHNITTVSKAGNRADIESEGPMPNQPNCWQIVTIVQPSGEDCIKVPLVTTPVCNCKGRGWIELSVKLKPAS